MSKKHDACQWDTPDSWGHGPPPLCGHTLSIVNRKAYLIGGCGPLDGEPQVFDHIYSLDLLTWKWEKLSPRLWNEAERTQSPEAPEEFHSAVKLFGFGGGGGKHKSASMPVASEPAKISALHPSASVPARAAKTAEHSVHLSPPQARWKHSACVIGPHHALVFGGIGSDDQATRLGDAWILDLSQQASADSIGTSTAPNDKNSSSQVLEDSSRTASADPLAAAEFPPEGPDSFAGSASLVADAPMQEHRPIWMRPKTDLHMGPTPRSHHTAICHRDKVWIFGGYGGDKQARMHLGDLICLHARHERAKLWAPEELLEWARPEVYGTSPKPRSGHSASTVENVMIVAGGRDHHGLLADAHVFNFDSDTWSTLRDAMVTQVMMLCA